MIKLVAIDLDGTLLNRNHKVSELNKKAIKKALGKNLKIVLCSGRTVQNVLSFAKELEIIGKEEYVVGFNGAGALRLDDEEFIFKESLSGKDAKFIAKICDEVDANYTVHTFYESLTPRENPYSTYESALNEVELFLKHPRELVDDDEVTKVLILDDPEIINEYEAHIREHLSHKYDLIRTMPFYLEVLKKGINKYSGIMAVADLLQIKKDEIMALGDAPNDLEIVRDVGIGIAMGNTEEIVKAHADFITKSNEEHGVAYAMNHFLGLGLDEYFEEVKSIE